MPGNLDGIAGADLQFEFLAGAQHVGDGRKRNGVLVDLAGDDWLRVGVRVHGAVEGGAFFIQRPVGCLEHASVKRKAFSTGTDRPEFGDEGGVWLIELGENVEHHRPGDFHRCANRLGRVGQ